MTRDEIIVDCVTELLADPNYNYGGQHVGSPNNPIKVTHTPSGLVAICGSQRSQHRNRIIALDMIEYGIVSSGGI